MIRNALILLFSGFASLGLAQENELRKDTINGGPKLDTLRSDSITIKKGGKIYTIESYAKRFDPRKALLYSAVLPGAGQAYNRKYWKVPLVYGGFGIITYYVIGYNNVYERYKGELFDLLKEPSSTTSPSGYTEAQLRNIVDTSRRQRDFFIVLDGIWYILQFVDAHIDAHLKEFDVNPNLKVSLAPNMQQSGLVGKTTGFSLTLKF